MFLRFVFNNKELLNESNICIIFYYNQQYMGNFKKEIEVYAVPETIVLSTDPPPASSYDTWLGISINGVEYQNWVHYFEIYYKKIAAHMNLDLDRIVCNIWQPEPYLNAICAELPAPCKDIDILIINGTTHSGQYNRDRSAMDNLCRVLDTSYNIITTRKVDNINCTLDYDLRIRDIAALATRARFVVALHTGPLCALYNEEAKKAITKWFLIVTSGQYFIHTDIDYTMITNGNLSPIYTYFSQPR
jgi:hypothetical protein